MSALPGRDPMMARITQLALPLAVVGIVGLLVIPVPTVVLDLLISCDIALSMITLLTTVYVTKPVQFSSFPSVLLLLTLFRLGLNVATTRRILLYGAEGTAAAGHMIEAFGQFVVGGSYVIGLVVFLHPAGHPVHRHQPRRRAHRRSDRPVHPGRHARQADGHRRRPERRLHRRDRGPEAPPGDLTRRPTSTAPWTAP